jgi:hypothetical protein
MSVFLSDSADFLSARLSVDLSGWLSVCLAVWVAVCLAASVCLSVEVSVCRSVCLQVCLSAGLSVCRSVEVSVGGQDVCLQAVKVSVCLPQAKHRRDSGSSIMASSRIEHRKETSTTKYLTLPPYLSSCCIAEICLLRIPVHPASHQVPRVGSNM